MTIPEMQKRLGDIHEQSAALMQDADDGERSLTTEDEELISSNSIEFERLKGEIQVRTDLEAQSAHLATATTRKTEPSGPRLSEDDGSYMVDAKPEARVHVQHASMRDTARWGWRSLGEQAKAIREASRPGGTVDVRLEQRDAPTTFGVSNVGADGGFAIAPDFRNAINQIIEAEDSLFAMADVLTTTSNSITIPMDDTTPWQTTGDILANWEGEGNQLTQTKPNLTQQTIRLNRLSCLVPVTEELMEDSAALSSWLSKKAPEKLQFAVNLAILQGSGAGQPLGILNSNCLVTVAIQANQNADTILGQNILQMHMRMYAPARRDAVWFINQDIEAQLNSMGFEWYAEGQQSGSSTTPVYMPPGGLSAAPYGTLMGRPIFPTQACETLGDVGDIIFASMKQYLGVTKGGGVRQAVSVHLWFDFNMAAFRFDLRIGGQPWWGNTVAARDGTTTYSPFVTLAVRA